VRPEPADGKTGKVKKAGRHAAPRPARKVTGRAGKTAAAVAVIGALAALPQLRSLVSAPLAASAGHRAIAQLNYSDEVISPPADSPVWFKQGSYPRGRAAVIAAIKSVKSESKPARDSGDAVGQPGRHSRRSDSSDSSHSKGSPGSSTKARTLSCTGTAGMLPANYAAIVGFLTAHGYTGFAAAGIAGNIYQESGGNPESAGSGGGGLIGWTPLPAGFVTGSPAADLQTQLAAILAFNRQWAQYLPALNAATSAAAAADIYMSDFERPGIPAAANREAAASAVAQACGLLINRRALAL
jgi:hypothetical protein